jgi:hypothetical protein
MITINDTYIVPRGVTEIENITLRPTFIKVLSIPATITHISGQGFGRITVPHLRLPKNIEYGDIYGYYL